MPREYVFDFIMARNGLFLARSRIEVNVMARAMPVQDASVSFKLSDELSTSHRAISLV